MLKVNNLFGGYDKNPLIKGMSFHIRQGEFFGIIGPNGSGKTTLLKMLSKTLPYKKGEVFVRGRDLSEYTSKELAKIVAVLPQHMTQSYSYTVRETVSLGRYAHQRGLFKTETDEDERVITEVMEQTGVYQYASTLIDRLSGGERQRVFLAQALAQEPEILFLDEPTNHLDLSYQKELLDILRSWTREKNLTVVAIFHDLNLAGLYCDRLMLMDGGRVVMTERPDKVLKKQEIESVYKANIEQHPHPKVPRPQMLLIPEADPLEKVSIINEGNFRVTKEFVHVESPVPLKTMSSGITGSGLGWYRHFINREVDPYYDCADYVEEMKGFLTERGFHPDDTVSMMTAVNISDVEYVFLGGESEAGEKFSVFVVATAAAGNAVDASFGGLDGTVVLDVEQNGPGYHPDTINIWIFINGNVTDQAFIQAIITATEAKVKALNTLHVRDKRAEKQGRNVVAEPEGMIKRAEMQGRDFEAETQDWDFEADVLELGMETEIQGRGLGTEEKGRVLGTESLATGTPTDSILVAGTQQGAALEFAGTATALGQLIGKGVYHCVTKSLERYFNR